MIIYMQAHDFLFADTADDSTTGIKTRHREHQKRHGRASEETQTSPHPNSRESLKASDRDNKIQC